MKLKKRRNDDEQENLDRWLITYSDLITLLLAFFIMMYTFAKHEGKSNEELTQHLKAIFKGQVLVPKDGAAGGSGAAGDKGVSDNGAVDKATSDKGGAGDIAKQLEEQLAAISGVNDPEHKISVFTDERGIVIRIMDRAFFDPGRAELKETAKNALLKILPILEKTANHVRIEGHTDNVPIRTPEFRSNWELSTRRATEVVRYLIETHGFPPNRLSASGYAEYRPVAKNDTDQDRALNRRIEIILLRAAEPSGT